MSAKLVKELRERTGLGLLECKKALAAALSQIEKQFGKGSVMRMGDASAVRDIEVMIAGGSIRKNDGGIVGSSTPTNRIIGTHSRFR